ncbi:MAG: DUF3857 domain-containing protein [Alphaproteobacteria bacterium]|nr:DUF3857 domain-containing protein [Alphaproteobacteria bacterium]MBU2378284.1 DUF3857 domain-containing protein [Alphaproteobacteria bacterium]
MAYDKFELERRGVTFGSAPAAFDLGEFQFTDRDPRALSDRGICFWLSQSQSDLTGAERVFTYRSIQEATGDEGLQSAARVDVDFHPDDERIVLHTVKVRRADGERDALDPANIDILQRELNLERAIYDGRKTMHMVVPDVRVGDVVEVIYSIYGANPVLRDAFAWWFILQWSVAVVETRAVVRLPSDRMLTIRRIAGAPDPAVVEEDGVRTLTWRVVDLEPYRSQAGAPLSFVGFQAVHVADRLSWAQIADLYRGGYYVPLSIPADLGEMAAEIREAHQEDPGKRMVEGLRLVQGLLRYHSVGIGDGGFRPRPIDQIWATRYGDCKDGSRLLATVLKALEIDAVCALVATRYGGDLDQTPPNAQAFDHCIVRARIGSETYWLDATRSAQAGIPSTLTQDDYAWALPLEADARLQPMNPQAVLSVCESTERWLFAAEQSAPARLELETIYRGWRADSVRRWIANDGPKSVERQWREGLEKEVHSPLATFDAPVIEDDHDANVLRIIERYEVARPLQIGKDGDQTFVSRDDVVGPHVKTMAPGRRVEPFQLGLPRRIVTTRILEFPTHVAIAPWSESFEGPGGQSLATSLIWEAPKTAVHRLSYTVRQRTLEADDADRYREFAAKALRNNGISFSLPFEKGRMKNADRQAGWRTWSIVALFIVALAVWRSIQG